MVDHAPEYEENSIANDYVHVRYRFGDAEMEVQGPNRIVTQHTLSFFAKISLDAPVENYTADALENDTPLLGDNGVSGESISGESFQKPHDLITFYHKVSPKDQRGEVLTIAYAYQEFWGYDHLSLDDFSDAYDILRQVPVETPSNMKSTVRNVVDRTQYMFNPHRGKFALTDKGKKFVEQLLAESDA